MEKFGACKGIAICLVLIVYLCFFEFSEHSCALCLTNILGGFVFFFILFYFFWLNILRKLAHFGLVTTKQPIASSGEVFKGRKNTHRSANELTHSL